MGNKQTTFTLQQLDAYQVGALLCPGRPEHLSCRHAAWAAAPREALQRLARRVREAGTPLGGRRKGLSQPLRGNRKRRGPQVSAPRGRGLAPPSLTWYFLSFRTPHFSPRKKFSGEGIFQYKCVKARHWNICFENI